MAFRPTHECGPRWRWWSWWRQILLVLERNKRVFPTHLWVLPPPTPPSPPAAAGHTHRARLSRHSTGFRRGSARFTATDSAQRLAFREVAPRPDRHWQRVQLEHFTFFFWCLPGGGLPPRPGPKRPPLLRIDFAFPRKRML